MKHTVLFTAFLCVATTFTAKSNDLEAEVFDCNSIHATASVETLDRNYAYILETLISPGICITDEDVNNFSNFGINAFFAVNRYFKMSDKIYIALSPQVRIATKSQYFFLDTFKTLLIVPQISLSFHYSKSKSK